MAVAKPGEVHEEYIKFREKYDDERKAEDRQQEIDSLTFIKKMLSEESEEDEKRKKIQLLQDEEYAKIINREIVS